MTFLYFKLLCFYNKNIGGLQTVKANIFSTFGLFNALMNSEYY